MKRSCIFVFLLALAACVSGNLSQPTPAPSQTVCINCNLATPTPAPTPTPSPGPTAGVTPSPMPTTTALPNTIYVATTGSDSNTGTCPASSAGCTGPYLTVEKAFQVATAGKRINVAGGTYTATSASNTGQCAGGCLAFQLNTGTAPSPITIQCQTMQACTFSGTSAATGALYAIVPNNAASYLTMIGFNCINFKGGCVQLNGGAGGATKANTNLVFEYNNCHDVGLTCVLGGAYSTDNLMAYNSIDYVGSYNGYSSCPGSNANDHGFYLQAARQTLLSNTFGSHILCGWPLQLADDTPGTVASAIMVGNSFGDRSHVVAPSTAGIFVLYQGTQGHTPSMDFENNAMYNSTGAYAHCFSQTAAGNPTITLSHNVMGDNNSLTDCGGTYTFINVGNIRNVNIGFLVSPPSAMTDFEVHNTSPLCNAALPYTGWLTDIVGVNRPQVFVNPDVGAFSCNGY